MFDLDSAAQVAERDFGAIIDRLDGLPDIHWDDPVRCAGWAVGDLAAHLAGASRGQAEGLRRATAGSADLAVLDPPAGRDPRALLGALKDGRDQLLAALRGLTPQAMGGVVPLPFGLLPAPVALQVIALEYGFHRNDLDWALGSQVPLGEDMSTALLGILPGLLPILAAGSPVGPPGVAPAGPTSFRLLAPGARLLAAHAGQAWSIGPDAGNDPVSCEIRGDDSSIALFVMGRVGTDHPGISVTDVPAARAFKQYFPGP
jgi:uncharacterized protein (TIGR03083 family)